MDELLAELLGTSPAVDALREQLRRLARISHGGHPPSVLLLGETGTGKSMAARLLHRAGPRRAGPFVDVNCAAIPETLLEAELFGFERGAFTDARRSKAGLFQAAHGGVLFLDEVGLLSAASQAKLLTAVEERAVRRLGSTRAEPSDVWLISATNTDLRAAVSARRFREDLYHRLSVLTLDVPALRERGDDVLLLAERLLARVCAEYGLPQKRLDRGAETRLRGYHWPGNIRELGNVIERAALFADEPVVTGDMLGALCAAPAVEPAPPPADRTAASRDEARRQRLEAALAQSGWNISRAAARLGISRNTARARIERFGLRAPTPGAIPAGPAAPPVDSPAATGRLRWEPRGIALLRVDVRDTDAADGWSRSSRVLGEILAKVQAFGGRVEEVAATGVVAAFGLDPAEDAPRRAALAAIAIQRELTGRRQRNEKRPVVTSGLHVAPLLIGRAGARVEIDARGKRTQWPILDQLLAASASGETVASAAAASFLERRFEIAPAGQTADGLSPVFRLTGRERRGLGLWGALTPFVGRQAELEFLQRCSALAKDGRGQVAAILAEAGAGKSRLIYEFAEARRLEGWRVLETEAVSYGRAMRYLPVIALLKRYFGLQDRDDAGEIAERVASRLLALDGALKPALPPILALLDAPVDDPEWGALEPAQHRQRTLDALRRLLLCEAREQPLLLVVEDLHWIDGETQAFLDGVVDALRSASLLLLVSYRPEYQPPWGSKSSYNQLRLDALPAAPARELLDALLGPDTGLEPLKRVLVKRGNPFFLEETVRTLVEARALDGPRGEYRLARPLPALSIPPTVEAVLAARIARLAPEDKRLLQNSAVIGRSAPVTLLRAVADADEPALEAGLARLQAAEFVCEGPSPGETEYRFVHALTHEVAYGGMLPERRRELHARVVTAIETLHGDRLAEQIERLAYHAVRGELREKAVHYLRQAGIRAAARSAPREARSWLEQALDVLASLPESPPTLEQGFEIRFELRPLLVHLGEVRPALDRMREALGLAERLKDDRRRGRASAVASNAHSLLGELDDALAAATRAREIAERLGDLRLRILATTYLMQAHQQRGEYARVVELGRENIEALPAAWVDETFGAAIPITVYDRYRLIPSLAQLGRFAEAERYEAEILRLAAQTHHATTVAMVHDAASSMHLLRGDWEKGRQLIERGIPAHRTGNSMLTLASAVAVSAAALARVGEREEALARLREGQQLLEGLAAQGIVVQLGSACHWLGRAALLLDRPDEARRFADRGGDYSASQPGLAAHVHLLRGDIAARDGGRAEDERGLVCYREALALAEPRGMRPLMAHCYLGLARLFQRAGRRADALAKIAAAVALYGELGMPFWLEQAEAVVKALT